MRPRPGGACTAGGRAHARARKMDRAPSVVAGTRDAAAVSELRSGAPVAPGGDRLRLLPSGSDLVHGPPSPRDRTITASRHGADPGPVPLGRGFSPARADCGYRAPLAPRLARSGRDPSGPRLAAAACAPAIFSR